ncbi:Resolvase, N terminal domain [Popillia japonica]|uniref:Resolvase, N terminal domain n=1 Tax=Popillia japonica TaxID=7064 RepID=A0AAW1HW58_POPJA
MIKKETGIIKVAKYIRVSTDRQAKAGDSLREQDETLTEYINKNERMILSNTYIDDGISGQKLDRDDFSRLMKDVKADNIDLIVFTKLDRWFRSLRHYLNTQAILEAHSVSWTAVSQPFFDTTTAHGRASQPFFDTTTAHGRAFVAQSMTWAELEAQNDSERILSVFENKVKNGEVISGSVPFGYSIKEKSLVPNEDAEKVAKLFERYLADPNVRALQRYAESELGTIRSHRQLRRTIRDAKYKGEFRGNPSYCQPLVSVEVWEECNRLLSRNQKANKSYDYVFAGLVQCADCGRMMSAATTVRRRNNKKKKPKTGEGGDSMYYKYPGYRCQARISKRKCINAKYYFEATLEKHVLGRAKDTLKKNQFWRSFIDVIILDNNHNMEIKFL